MARISGGVWACAVFCSLSCGSSEDGDDQSCRTAPPRELTGCATAYYFGGDQAPVLPECDAQHPVLPIDEWLELKLFKGSKINDLDVARNTRALQRYFAPHALQFQTESLPEAYRITYAMRGTAAEFEAAVRGVGIDPFATALSGEEEAIVMDAVSHVMFREARAFLNLHAKPAEHRVNVVVMRQIVAPELAEYLQVDGTVVGLGLSWALLQRQEANPGVPTLNTLFQIEGDFTPTLFVGHADIQRLARQSDTIVAHELGHALGLSHAVEPDNLMAPAARVDCRGWLSAEQVAMMGPFNGPPAAEFRWQGAPETASKHAEFTFQELPRAVVREVLRRRSLAAAVQPRSPSNL